MSKYFKHIAKSLATQAGIEVVRGYVIARMRKVTADDLYKAITDGTHTMGVAEDKDRKFGRKWSRIIETYTVGGKKLRREMLTPENVLKWLKEDRPDLASLIMNMGPKGQKWLEEDVRQIFSFLFPKTEATQPKPKPALTLTLTKRVQQEQPSSNPETREPIPLPLYQTLPQLPAPENEETEN